MEDYERHGNYRKNLKDTLVEARESGETGSRDEAKEILRQARESRKYPEAKDALGEIKKEIERAIEQYEIKPESFLGIRIEDFDENLSSHINRFYVSGGIRFEEGANFASCFGLNIHNYYENTTTFPVMDEDDYPTDSIDHSIEYTHFGDFIFESVSAHGGESGSTGSIRIGKYGREIHLDLDTFNLFKSSICKKLEDKRDKFIREFDFESLARQLSQRINSEVERLKSAPYKDTYDEEKDHFIRGRLNWDLYKKTKGQSCKSDRYSAFRKVDSLIFHDAGTVYIYQGEGLPGLIHNSGGLWFTNFDGKFGTIKIKRKKFREDGPPEDWVEEIPNIPNDTVDCKDGHRAREILKDHQKTKNQE